MENKFSSIIHYLDYTKCSAKVSTWKLMNGSINRDYSGYHTENLEIAHSIAIAKSCVSKFWLRWVFKSWTFGCNLTQNEKGQIVLISKFNQWSCHQQCSKRILGIHSICFWYAIWYLKLELIIEANYKDFSLSFCDYTCRYVLVSFSAMTESKM